MNIFVKNHLSSPHHRWLAVWATILATLITLGTKAAASAHLDTLRTLDSVPGRVRNALNELEQRIAAMP
jgi:hypothetical protein